MEINNIFGSEQNDSLTFKLPSSRIALNRELSRELKQMKDTAAHYRMLYLTANQVENLHRLFIINKHYSTGIPTHDVYKNPLDYQTYINPVIVEARGEQVEVEENCLVIPFLRFKVPRFKEIKLEFRDEMRDYRTEIISG
jgi:peptide deformylase